MGCLSDKSNLSNLNNTSIPEGISFVSKSIVNINYKDKMNKGFLIKLFRDDKEFFCLITGGEKIISKDMIEQKEDIKFFYDNESKIKKISLNSEKRLIKNFKDIGIDSTVIEILPEDKIENDFFLSPYINNFNELKDEDIFIIQFPKGIMTYSTGKIKNINKNDFIHTIKIENEFEGNPIFLKGSNKVIGIQKNSENEANFIGPIFNYFQNLKYENKIKDNADKDEDKNDSGKKGEDGIIELQNGNYYKGDIKNGNMHGKGKIFSKNDDLIYEGDFVNDKFEGNGKLIQDNKCYIGQFKEGKKHGKGKLYKNDKLIYEGDFFNDKADGNGKQIYDNGDYYIGQFKQAKRHGKGKLYTNEDILIYDGDFVDDKLEGEGKVVFEDGRYYIGQNKDGIPNGKGTTYDEEGNIIYEGDYVNGVPDGTGKYIYDDGSYYIGQIKNAKRHGKGKFYDDTGKIIYEGDYVNDLMEGNGKYFYEDGIYYKGQFKNGLKDGKGEEYNKDGSLIRIITYDKDFEVCSP